MDTAIRRGLPPVRASLRSTLADGILENEIEEIVRRKLEEEKVSNPEPVNVEPTHVERLISSVIGATAILILLVAADLHDLKRQLDAGMNLAELRERDKRMGR